MVTRSRSTVTATALGVMVASVTALGSTVLAAGPASASVSIDAPVAPTAGTVTLTGRVGPEAGETTTVMYVFDATMSTEAPTGADCSGNGGVGAEDDLNRDGSVGDVLDCEIAGVESLNRSLATTSGVQAGLVAFSNDAAAADLDPVGSATFLPPGFTGGDPRPRIDTVAESVVRNRIGLYDPRELGGSGAGTAFNSATTVALSTLATAPAGPKWIMFLSDGRSPVDDGVLQQLAQSGVRMRTYGIGADASCDPFGSLYKMAAATGEACRTVPQPASLAAELTGSTPDAVNGVSVTIGTTSVAATVDAVGGWKAPFTLGAGTYTAVVRAVLASGVTQTAQRTFTVAPAPGGPAAGTVDPGPGALQATVVKVKVPKPTRAALPPKVTGRAGRPVDGLTTTSALTGAQVLLQGRATEGAPWTTVDKGKVNRKGQWVLKWKPQAKLRLLQVALQPVPGFAGSAAAVPSPKISACKVKGKKRWSVTCSTTAKKGSAARLLAGKKVVDGTRVRRGSFTLHGTGRVGQHTIDVKVGKRHVRLAL